MACIILIDADNANYVEIIKDDFGDNLVFDTWQDADIWLEDNAQCGWCTRLVDLDD